MILCFFVFVLLDPAKSAEPPIRLLFELVNALKVNSEHFLVAKLLGSLIASFFSEFKTFLKLFFLIRFNFLLCFLIILFHFFSPN